MKNLIIWPFLIGIVLFVNNCHTFEDDFNFVSLDKVENKVNSYYKLDLVRSKRDSNNEDKKLNKNKEKLFLSKFNLSDSSSILEKTPELSEEIEKNKNNTIDDHSYYKVSFFPSDEKKTKDYWVDISKTPETKRHEMLSNAHRRAATVKLSFKFPFYGFKIENITIATGGFLFLGDAVHTWLAATQYIAPLMANFDSSIDKKSNIYYLDNNNSFVVQWDNVYLQEIASNSSSNNNSTVVEKDKSSEKPFSFQVTLKENGDIIFVYKNVPLEVLKINEDKHPVKVGISDAYIIDRTVFFIRRKTIYEYHKAELKNKNITDNTVIYFEALPTCNTLKDCTTCTTKKINFECQWCEANQRCSDGFDRHRQEWLKARCVDNSKSVCLIPKTTDQPTINVDENSNVAHSNNQAVVKPNNDNINKVEKEKIIINDKAQAKNFVSKENKTRRSSFATGFILLTLIAIVAYWGMYAYRNPQSRPGQFLIKYRPAQWSLHNSETRYATEFDSIS